jgi:hypothetical protein
MRRFVNHFIAEKPGGIKVVVQEWCLIVESNRHGEVYGDSRLVTGIGIPVTYNAATGQFALTDGTPLTTSDPLAEETRRRMNPPS